MCCITAPLPVPASKERRMRIPRRCRRRSCL
nr:MAG TPA: hypothetical protein [Caudoviricetes sp.]